MLLEPVPAIDLDPSGGLLADDGDHPFVLVVRKRGAFARRADGTDAIGPALDVKVDQLAQGGLVDRAVAKRRHQGDRQPGETSLLLLRP